MNTPYARKTGIGGAFRAAVALIALGAVAGILGANPLADAAGFAPSSSTAVLERFACGLALGVLVLFGVPTLLGALGGLAGRLAAVPTRPPLFVSMVLIVSGTLCLLAALGVAAVATAGAGGPGVPTVRLDGGMPFGAEVSTPAGSSPVVALVALLVLLTGVGMAAAGIWCALPPSGDAGPDPLAGPYPVPKPRPLAEM
jgi:hypothetical protein